MIGRWEFEKPLTLLNGDVLKQVPRPNGDYDAIVVRDGKEIDRIVARKTVLDSGGFGGVCVHDWQPVPGYAARYRCPACGAFGYKAKVVTGFGGPGIVPYKCRKCGAPAVGCDPVSRTTLRYRSGAVRPRGQRRSVAGRKEWRCGSHRSQWA